MTGVCCKVGDASIGDRLSSDPRVCGSRGGESRTALLFLRHDAR
jgi:hypothetical protein